jgi:hypothetical protein
LDDAARGFAAENSAQDVTVSADPLVDNFCDENDSGEPEKK